MKNKYTLVTTCLNEAASVRSWIKDVQLQTQMPDEIVVLDAGSSDGTYDVLVNWAASDGRVVVIQEMKASVARGRNLAIRHAAGNVIVSTDMGCSLSDTWFAEMISPFELDDNVEAVAGGYRGKLPEVLSVWASVAWALSNGNKPLMNGSFLPSSRSIAYRKKVWSALNGYPEDLKYAADDTVFALQLRASEFSIKNSDNAIVYWHRPRSLDRYKKERRGYGFGEGEALIFQPKILRKWRMAPAWILCVYSVLVALKDSLRIFHRLALSGKRHLVFHALYFSMTTYSSFLFGYRDGVLSGDAKCDACRKRIVAIRDRLSMPGL